MPAVPDSVRDTVRAKAEGLETQALHGWLSQKDPAMANRLRPSDRQRLIRALEIFEATGRSLSEWQSEPHSPPCSMPANACASFSARSAPSSMPGSITAST